MAKLFPAASLIVFFCASATVAQESVSRVDHPSTQINGGPGIAFQKLIDSSFVAPDGQLLFTLERPQMQGGTVAFIGATSTPDSYLFAVPATGGKPTVLASNHTKVPDGVGKFTASFYGYFTAFEPPGCASPAIGSKSVVFVGRDAAGNEGVYSVPAGGGNVVKLADYKTPIPGGPVNGYTNFNVSYSFCNISLSGDTVVFDAGGDGVYSVGTDGKNIARIADPNTPAVIDAFEVNGFAQPSISGKQIAYIGSTVFGPYAIFVGAPKPRNALVVATRNVFDNFSYPENSSQDIDFAAHLKSPDEGLFRVAASGGNTTKIMNLNTKIPKGTPGTSFSGIGSTSNGENWFPAGSLDVFAAQTTDGTNNYAGLFSVCEGGKLAKVLTQGDVLDGVDVQPGAGISNLVAVAGGYQGAIVVTGDRYAAIYTLTIPGC